MKGLLRKLIIIVAIFLFRASTSDAHTGVISADVDYELLMPDRGVPLQFSLELTEQPNTGDNISPVNYLIVSYPQKHTADTVSFSAYIQGKFYKFQADRLQEIELPDTTGVIPDDLPRNEMFASLLPSYLSEKIAAVKANHDNFIEFTPSQDSTITLSAREYFSGTLMREMLVRLSATDSLPLSLELTNNPGTANEQIIKAKYRYKPADAVQLTEMALKSRFSEIFENFSKKGFSIKSLVGRPMPSFSLPAVEGQRIAHRRGDGFQRPTVIALLASPDSCEIIEHLRKSLRRIEPDIDLIYVFRDGNKDSIKSKLGNPGPTEAAATRGAALARIAGCDAYPTLIFCDTTGIIRDVATGANNNTETFVNSIENKITFGDDDIVLQKQSSTNLTSTMSTVYFKSTPVEVYGQLPVVGSMAPEFHLTSNSLTDISLADFPGKRVVLNIFPSLDTDVCAASVRRFNQEATKIDNVAVVCVSMDLPFAMSRFCTINGIENVVPASAFRSPEFAKDYGVMMVDGPLKGLLARAVVVLDEDGRVLYTQLVEEITNEPDYNAVTDVLKRD